ncbi:hypothetical protein [Nonomuraea sp. KM90]|uniref:hypothetical protein n=1 Tax=Nonomuraea sp. KM90 TaxID=3457428 RepID=UPI003FCE28EC
MLLPAGVRAGGQRVRLGSGLWQGSGAGVVARQSRDSDHEVSAGCFDDFLGDGDQLVDLQDAFNLVNKSGGRVE